MKPVFVTAILVFLLSGCSQITRIEQTVLNLEKENEDLKAELARYEEEYLQPQRDEFKAFVIAQDMHLQRIEKKVDNLSGNITESNQRITEINQKTGVLTAQLREKAVQDSLVQSQADAERRDMLELGVKDFQLGNYKQAISLFTSFMETYPEAPELGDAIYWNGEANLAMLKHEVAQEMFKKYIKDYSDGTYYCSSIYKLGLSYQKQNDNARRDAFWGKLKELCPDSKEAKLVEGNK